MDLLAAMRLYVRVVERGSFSGAARDLALKQSSVSSRIKLLETQLGVQLLLRSTRAQICTNEGQVFYVHSKRVVEAADAACAAVARDGEVRGTLRMAAPQLLGDTVLPLVLSRMRDRYPELCIELVLNDQVADPATEGVELSLRLGRAGVGNFIVHRLGKLHRSLVAAPSYLARHPPITGPEDLVQHSFIRQSYLFGNGRLPLRDPRQSLMDVPIRDAFVINHWSPVFRLLLAGAGIGVVADMVCADELKAGRLVRLLPSHSLPELPCHALVAPTRPISARTRAMMAMLKQSSAPVFRPSESVAA